MNASDLMTAPVVTVSPDTQVVEAVRLMLDRGLSGLPVVAKNGAIVGILTEGDLMRRVEIGNYGPSGSLRAFFAPGKYAEDYVQAHARTVDDVMTRDVRCIAEDTPLARAADIMLTANIKRLPVTRDAKLVGILARRDLLKAIMLGDNQPSTAVTDAEIEHAMRKAMHQENWVPRVGVQIRIADGVIELSGSVPDERERSALRVIAENVPGAKGVVDHLVCIEPISGAVMDQL